MPLIIHPGVHVIPTGFRTSLSVANTMKRWQFMSMKLVSYIPLTLVYPGRKDAVTECDHHDTAGQQEQNGERAAFVVHANLQDSVAFHSGCVRAGDWMRPHR